MPGAPVSRTTHLRKDGEGFSSSLSNSSATSWAFEGTSSRERRFSNDFPKSAGEHQNDDFGGGSLRR
jgi:hypothetical protein